MASILQGTTPSLKIIISEEDFRVEDITQLELTFRNAGKVWKTDSVTTDPAENSITYSFTEEETLALDATERLYYQYRFWFQDGSIIGTKKASVSVSVLLSEESGA